ncbi:alanine--tRNA ligase [Patescibacteria group bacterium]|nr:alanine--tRNA ligase [Patescibacteria group bacterium]
MDYRELRQKFISFWQEQGHALVPSSSLIPQHDASVLLTTAGMQQFKPYFTGTPSPYGASVVSIQKCFRTADIDEIGDDTHLTFFEMLGHFSFGDYFKDKALKLAWQFITSPDYLGIDPKRIYASYYNGDRPNTTADDVSKQILESLPGLTKVVARGAVDNFWGPTGDEGPCGPNVEFYVDDVEIWNEVFNEFYCQVDGALTPLSTPGVDMGGGLERILTAVTPEATSLYDTDAFAPIIEAIKQHAPGVGENERSLRIISDHLRGSVFLLGDHIQPSNKEQGYILRRLLRRAILHLDKLGAVAGFEEIITTIINQYGEFYPELLKEQKMILQLAALERDKFLKTIADGQKELAKILNKVGSVVDGEVAFSLFSTYGLPLDFVKEEAQRLNKSIDLPAYDQAFAKHQEVSRAGVESKFGGHGLASGAVVSEADKQIITRMHTATHLLHAALIKFLGPEVKQGGSDLTTERIRFDFTFSRGMTTEEKQQVEDWVNARIKQNLKVLREEKPIKDALAEGALSFFKEKYPDIVSVYTIYNESTGEVVSKELCGGPHIEHTGEIGAFHITKEQSSSAGVRRIRATIGK